VCNSDWSPVTWSTDGSALTKSKAALRQLVYPSAALDYGKTRTPVIKRKTGCLCPLPMAPAETAGLTRQQGTGQDKAKHRAGLDVVM